MLQSCKCDPDTVSLPKLAAQEGFCLFFSLLSQSIFYLLALLSSPGVRLSTRDDDDDVNANMDEMEKQGSPSPLIRRDLLGFFLSVFFLILLAGTVVRSCTAGGLDQHCSALPRGRRRHKAQCHGNRIKKHLKTDLLTKSNEHCVGMVTMLALFFSSSLFFFCVLPFFALAIPFSILVGEGGEAIR